MREEALAFLDRRNIRIFQAAFPQMLTLKVAWYTPFFTTIMKVNIIPVNRFNGNYDKITTIPTELKYPSGVIISKDSPSTIYLGTELYWDSTNNVFKGGGAIQIT